MMALAQALIAWVNVFVAGSGAVLCGLNLARSRWAIALTAGFATEAAVLVSYRAAIFLTPIAGLRGTGLSMFFIGMSLIGTAARISVVAGAVGVLSELRAREGATGPAELPPPV